MAGSGLSEREARGLTQRALEYGSLHPGSFGGAWFAYPDGGDPVVFAAFTGELGPHAAALDARIRVVAATRTAAEREELVARIRAFVEAYDGAQVESAEYDRSDGERIFVEVEAADEVAFDRDLRAAFGTFPDVYYLSYERYPWPITQWDVDRAQRELTAWWNAGRGGPPVLVADESDGEVRLKLTVATQIGTRRSPTSVGEELHFGDVGPPAWEQSTSITLAAPLAGRPVVDDSRQPAGPIPRRWRLVVCDLDGTLIPRTSALEHLRAYLGHASVVDDLERKFVGGEITDREVAEAYAPFYAGVLRADAAAALATVPRIDDIELCAERLRSRSVETCIATVSWSFAAQALADAWGFGHACGAELEVDEASGTFTGRMARHFAPDDKVAWVADYCREHGIGMDQVVAVGDGRSDLPLFAAVGFSVALNASAEARAAATVAVDSSSLADALLTVPRLLR